MPADLYHYRRLPYTSVKAAVLPFGRFPGVDTMLGPEMKSTGEVMGIDADPGMALAKAMIAAGHALPARDGVRQRREPRQARDRLPCAATRRPRVPAPRDERDRGRAGTSRASPCERVAKVSEGPDNVVELIRTGAVDLVINTPFGRAPRSDGSFIRTAAAAAGRPVHHDLARGLRRRPGDRNAQRRPTEPRSIQEHHAAAADRPSQVRLTFDAAAAAESPAEAEGPAA